MTVNPINETLLSLGLGDGQGRGRIENSLAEAFVSERLIED